METMKRICAKALEVSKLSFRNKHKGDWHYEVEEETLDVDGHPIKRVYNFIKVGGYDGMDDIQYNIMPDGSIECNYREPCRMFDTLEEAYMCHNELWFLLEQAEKNGEL